LSVPQQPAEGWDTAAVSTLLAFGDSYTDETRLAYFMTHNGSAPPVGWIGPDNPSTFSGGHDWVRYVSYYTGATLYRYAVAGAVCSNHTIPRYTDLLDATFPGVRKYKVTAFRSDYAAGALEMNWSSTVVTMWIGTNDLGGGALLDRQQMAGKTVIDYVHCIFEQLTELYKLGARRFVLLNIAPLELAPLYAADSTPGPDSFWKGKGMTPRRLRRVWCR
jgi:hypothetical protein